MHSFSTHHPLYHICGDVDPAFNQMSFVLVHSCWEFAFVVIHIQCKEKLLCWCLYDALHFCASQPIERKQTNEPHDYLQLRCDHFRITVGNYFHELPECCKFGRFHPRLSFMVVYKIYCIQMHSALLDQHKLIPWAIFRISYNTIISQVVVAHIAWKTDVFVSCFYLCIITFKQYRFKVKWLQMPMWISTCKTLFCNMVCNVKVVQCQMYLTQTIIIFTTVQP